MSRKHVFEAVPHQTHHRLTLTLWAILFLLSTETNTRAPVWQNRKLVRNKTEDVYILTPVLPSV